MFFLFVCLFCDSIFHIFSILLSNFQRKGKIGLERLELGHKCVSLRLTVYSSDTGCHLSFHAKNDVQTYDFKF